MKKLISTFIVLTLFIGGTMTAQAETASSSNLTTIQSLLAQIKLLQDKISELQMQQSGLQQELTSSIKLVRQLSIGMSGEDVKLLQETLATDPDIYPEGLVTGYFGPLTAKAVKRFQEKEGFESVGNVGPKTFARINELLTQGAGNSGKVPPGLLRAPGIAKKLGNQATTTPDTTAPVISSISTSGVASTTLTVNWNTNELTDGRVWLATSTPVSTHSFTSNLVSSYTLTHSTTFSGLQASTTYFFLISAKDISGNTATSSEQSVSTSQ